MLPDQFIIATQRLESLWLLPHYFMVDFKTNKAYQLNVERSRYVAKDPLQTMLYAKAKHRHEVNSPVSHYLVQMGFASYEDFEPRTFIDAEIGSNPLHWTSFAIKDGKTKLEYRKSVDEFIDPPIDGFSAAFDFHLPAKTPIRFNPIPIHRRTLVIDKTVKAGFNAAHQDLQLTLMKMFCRDAEYRSKALYPYGWHAMTTSQYFSLAKRYDFKSNLPVKGFNLEIVSPELLREELTPIWDKLSMSQLSYRIDSIDFTRHELIGDKPWISNDSELKLLKEMRYVLKEGKTSPKITAAIKKAIDFLLTVYFPTPRPTSFTPTQIKKFRARHNRLHPKTQNIFKMLAAAGNLKSINKPKP